MKYWEPLTEYSVKILHESMHLKKKSHGMKVVNILQYLFEFNAFFYHVFF